MPENFRERTPDGLKNQEGRVSEELGQKITEKLSPDGWKTNNSLRKELVCHHRKIKKIADQFRDLHPEWFRNYLIESGQIYEHYSPELVERIREEFGKREKAPDGWKTNSSLRNELDAEYNRIKRIANKYRDTNPEWFYDYINEGGRLCEHYSPKLVEKIREGIVQKGNAPENWRTKNNLTEELGSHRKIKKIADQYRDSHPEWFHDYLDNKNRLNEHYSSELVEKIIEEFGKGEKAPDGWRTNSSLRKELSINFRKIKKIANKYRNTNPEWFYDYINEGGRLCEHYSPDLITKIKEELKIK